MKKFHIVKKDPFRIVKKCPGCKLGKHARKQVIGRGEVPAKLLFIGESPDKSEDVMGEPFVGPSGALLERMIIDASDLAGCKPPSYYLTNTVLCRAWVWDQSSELYGENREPKKSEILACKKNLLEIHKIIQPEFIVFVGNIAKQYYSKEFRESVRISHPETHLRFGGDYGGQASPIYNTDIRTLSDLFRKFR